MRVAEHDTTAPELRLYCYLLLASYDDAELIRASVLGLGRNGQVQRDAGARRRSLFRDAVRACAELADTRKREPRTADGARSAPLVAIPWLQPYPDRYLNGLRPADTTAERESVRLAFVAALQWLPMEQRAALVLREVLGWTDEDIGDVLDRSVAAVADGVRDGWSAVREHLPEDGDDVAPEDRRKAEKSVLERYMYALQQTDDAGLTDLLRADAWCARQPWAGGNDTDEPGYLRGRDAILRQWAPALHGSGALDFEFIPFWVNQQPGAATYVRMRGETESAHVPFGLTALGVVGDEVTEIAVFSPDLFGTFGLPAEV